MPQLIQNKKSKTKVNTMEKKHEWLMSSILYKEKPEKIKEELGIIEGAAVATAGEAKGHGVHLDSEFLDHIILKGNDKKQGIKVRFGHPNMSSTALGSFLGRAKNFKKDGDKVRADIFLSNSAKETPNGNLYDYVLELAAENPDMFGMSIVFVPGREYQRKEDGEKIYKDLDFDENVYIELETLLAADMVDSPAANPSGLFGEFNQATFAGQMTEFLDIHPEIFELVNKNPEIIDTFMERYKKYKARRGQEMEEGQITIEAALPDGSISEEETITQGVVAIETPQKDNETNTKIEDDNVESEDLFMFEADEIRKQAVNDFIDFCLEYDFEFAVENYGKDKETILQIKLLELEKENKKLKTKIQSDVAAEAASYSDEEYKGDFLAIVQNLKNAGLGASEAWRKAIKENSDLYSKYINKGE